MSYCSECIVSMIILMTILMSINYKYVLPIITIYTHQNCHYYVMLTIHALQITHLSLDIWTD